MNTEHQFRFKIDSYTPATIPMKRLAEYMAELALLLGHEKSVHFIGLEEGSAVLVQTVEAPEYPKVVDRVTSLNRGEARPEVIKAFTKLDAMLANDNAIGVLSDGGLGSVVKFPGRERPAALAYGAFTQDGSLDGTLIRVGGKDDTVPVHLQDGERIYPCNTTRELAREMAVHIFGAPLRVHGSGRWRRHPDGGWEMKFQVSSYEVLDSTDLLSVVAKLRAVSSAGWSAVPDPLAELQALRGDDSLH